MTLKFDESIPTLVTEVGKLLGAPAIERAVILRDSVGCLSLIFDVEYSLEVLKDISEKLCALLGLYARPDRLVATPSSPGATRLLKEAADVNPTEICGYSVRIIDRRIVGSDWLRQPAPSTTGIPKLVFASLKGGVGRSTALCVIAAYLSRRGRRVLAIDFDLEAPGIGTMLLNESELPKFGTLDYFVEHGISNIDEDFMGNLSGDSYLGAEGARVTVIPAIGKATLQHPENALGKIARAYIESTNLNGSLVGLSDKLRSMIDWFEATGAYDIILIDARAGLHETSAAAMLALGAETLLFGVDQPQTYLGYRLLMAHLARFPVDTNDDWRTNFCFVHAKASADVLKKTQAEERFISLYELLETKKQEVEPVEELTAGDFLVEWTQSEEKCDDQSFTTPMVLNVLDDSRYRDFDPITEKSQLANSTFYTTFESLISYVDTLIDDNTQK